MSRIELHQWTHTGEKVLFVRRCDKNMKSYGGFVWPKEGKLACSDWDPAPNCGNGLHGWPWGIGIGLGSDFENDDVWQVTAANPEDVSEIEFGKCKYKECEILLTGSMLEAMIFTLQGRMAWIAQTIEISNDANVEKGNRASSSSTGNLASSSSTGNRASSSSTGYRASSSSTGNLTATSITGEENTIDISPSSLASVCAERFTWVMRRGSVVVQRWREGEEGNYSYPFAILDSSKLELVDGETISFFKGQRVNS